MPEMTPVGNTIIPPDPTKGLDAYSRMLGIQQQRQALQIGAQTLQQEQAQTSIQTRIAQERQNLASVDWNQFQNEDGSYDEGAITKKALEVAPTTGEEFATKLNAMHKGSAETKAAWHGLDTSIRSSVRGIFGAVAADPSGNPAELSAQLEEYKESAPKDIQDKLGTIIDHSVRVMGQMGDNWRQAAVNLSRAGLSEEGLSGTGGLNTPQTGMVNTGPAVVPTTQSRTTGAMGIPPGGLKTGLPPSVQILTDANGRQYRYNTQTGQIENQVGQPGPGQTQGAGGFTQPVPNQPQVQAEIQQTRTADADYGVNRHINDQILRLSKDTSTGPGTAIWHHALGGIAGPAGGNNVADYQTIGAYLDRQAALSAKQMGLPDTNAGLATAASLSGTTEYQPKALQTKVKLTDALVEGAHQYREGLDKIVGTGPNQDLSKYQDYRAKWAANFDPTIFLVENALKRGEKPAQIQAELKLSGAQMKELKMKSDNLRKLSRGEL